MSGREIYKPELFDLMRRYALRGVAAWENADPELVKRASQCLGNKIANNVWLAQRTLNTSFNEQNVPALTFIPMPLDSPKPGFEWSFFLPLSKFDGGKHPRISFELLVLVRETHCLAYRFEQTESPSSTHSYSHFQLCRELLGGKILVSTPEWIPDSYPAHPLYSSDPMSMFLSMATAIHGYPDGMHEVLRRLFTNGNVQKVKDYGEMLTGMLVKRDSNHG